MWTLFISICVFGQCSWLEVESPVFHSLSRCESKASVFVQRLDEQLQDNRATVTTRCLDQESAEQFRQDHLKKDSFNIYY